MALGGGTYLAQNKELPGTYINFISAARATSSISERGVAAMPVKLSWGPEDEIFTVTHEDFRENTVRIFGHAYTDPEMAELRDLFLNIRAAHLYRINGGGDKASCTYCTAKYTGTRGNAIQVVIQANEASETGNLLYDVFTLFDGKRVDEQKAVSALSDLKNNDYVTWDTSETIALTAGTNCTGGTDGTVVNGAYQSFLDKAENYSFNTVGVATTDATIKALFANWTKRMRDEVGAKFQCVLYRHNTADHESIISVENKLVGEEDTNAAAHSASIVYWTTGAEAGCAVNKTLTNATYTGEFSIDAEYTQTQLIQGLKTGKLMLHKVNDTVRVLEDINTFASYTMDKNEEFSSNQTMRVLDQIGNDVAVLFNDRYLGKVPNDDAGRISLWNDLVKFHQELETVRAIEYFDPDRLTVDVGDNKKAVVITDYVTPVNAMAQLYMTVIVE